MIRLREQNKNGDRHIIAARSINFSYSVSSADDRNHSRPI